MKTIRTLIRKGLGYTGYIDNLCRKCKLSFKNTWALTYVEILIAMVIVVVVLSALYAGVNLAGKSTRHNANRTIAINYARALMEEIWDKEYEDTYASDSNYHVSPYTNFLGPELNTTDPSDDDDLDNDNDITRDEFDDVDDYNDYSEVVNMYQKVSVNIPATLAVEITDQYEDNILDSTEYSNINYKIVNVTISWTWLGRSYSEDLTTIISQHQ